MTESEVGADAAWPALLVQVSAAAGHELRNALNALVVNLEVVRSGIAGTPLPVQPFIAQAVQQSEESVRMAESTIAILSLIAGAVREDGVLRGSSTGARTFSIQAASGESERIKRALLPLASRTGIRVDTADSAIILTIPDTSS